MVGYYRVNDLGFRVAPGSFVLPVEGFAPVAEASALIEAAQARAEEIVADAVEARETEKQRGFEEGLREARLATIERMLRESVVLDARLRDVEKDLTGLVVACTRKLLDEFSETERAEATVKSALKAMRGQKRAQLHAPTAFYPHFRECAARLAAEFPDMELIDVIEDAGLQDGQIVVETAVGRVEGDLARRLEDIEALLRGVHASAQDQARGAQP